MTPIPIHILRSFDAPQFLCGEALTPVSVWWRQAQLSEGTLKSWGSAPHAQGGYQTCPRCWAAFISRGQPQLHNPTVIKAHNT